MGKAVKSVTKGVSGLLGGTAKTLSGKVDTGGKVMIDRSQFADSDAQKAMTERLKQRMEGKAGPSLAEMQLKQTTDRAIAQQQGAALSARGNQALAQREALRAGAGLQQEANAQAAQMRLAEQQQAEAAYAQDLQRQQDLKVQAELAQAGAMQDYAGRQAQASAQTQANRQGMLQGLAGGALQIFSDKKEKKNIKSQDLEDLVSKISAYKYNYKDEKNGKGEQVGVMAQDLEKSKLGKDLVEETPEGKMVDLKKAVPLMMASVSEIVKKIKKLEKDKG